MHKQLSLPQLVKYFTTRKRSINYNLKSAPGVKSYARAALMVLTAVIAIPCLMLGQTNQTGRIYGAVTDTSGAVVPGADVELTSPALIVPQSAKTDAAGAYHFDQIPLGTYTVTFTGQGFEKLVRPDVTITAGFSAQIDAKLVVGQVEQTVTVQAAGPVVNTQDPTITSTIQSAVLSTLPVTRDTKEFLMLYPGTQAGTNLPNFSGADIPTGDNSGGAFGLAVQPTVLMEGVNTRKSNSSAEGDFDFPTLEEFQVIPTAGDASIQTPGVFMSAIVKSGGNQFHGRSEYTQEMNTLQGNNITPYLAANGVTSIQGIQSVEDVDANVGGPIKRDRWWFFGGGHLNIDHQEEIGFLNPATNSPYIQDVHGDNWTAKSTYQLSKNYKLIGFATEDNIYFPLRDGTTTVPLSHTQLYTEPVREWKGEFSGTPNSHLALDFFVGHHIYQANYFSQTDSANIPSTAETSGYVGGPDLPQDRRGRHNTQMTGELSYVPSGDFWSKMQLKFGSTWMHMNTGTEEPLAVDSGGAYVLEFNSSGDPIELETYNLPLTANRDNLLDGGFYGEDTWQVLKRLSLNFGVRWDYYNAYNPPQSQPAGQFGGLCSSSLCTWAQSTTNPNIWTGVAHTYANQPIGTWQDVVPRVGGAYDIFGNGKMVFKASYGRFGWTPGDDFGSPFTNDEVAINVYDWTESTGCVASNVNNGSCAAVINPALPAGPGNVCTFALANAGGCNYVPGSVNLNPNGGDHLAVDGYGNGSATKLGNSIVNPNLSQQFSNEFQGYLENTVGPNMSLRAGITYIHNVGAWVQEPIGCANATAAYPCIPPSAWTQLDTFLNRGTAFAACETSPVNNCPAGATGTPFNVYDLPAGSPYTGSLYSATQYINTPNDHSDHFTTYEVTFTRRSAAKWDILATYTLINYHQWVNAAAGVDGPQPIPETPNQTLFPVNTSWQWQACASGTYNLPYQLRLAGTLFFYNGVRREEIEDLTGLNAGTLQIPVGQEGAVSGPFQNYANVKLSRSFRLKDKGTLEPELQMMNISNSSSAWTYTTNNYGPTYSYVSSTVPPRIARFGVVYQF